MADVHSPEIRSYNMSMIKGKNTKPEIIVRKYLFSKGFRFRLHDKKIIGKPDIVLKKIKTIIFINGCFWHGHKDCKYFVLPKTRPDWWLEKINHTIDNDLKSFEFLSSEGWQVIIIWECELRKDNRERTLNQIVLQLSKSIQQ